MKITREKELSKALQDTITPKEIQLFLSYSLNETDKKLIQETSEAVLINSKDRSMNCAAMSAFWSAMIQDNSNIPVAVICGDLIWNDKTIFHCKETIQMKNQSIEWGGHCWIECGDFIGDVSLFRTLKNEEKLIALKMDMDSKLGVGKGMICASSDFMQSIGLTYQPKFSLSNDIISGLINGAYSSM